MTTRKDEKETLKQASEAAAALISRKQQDRAKLDAEISRLQSVIDAWDTVSGKKLKKPLPLQINVFDEGTGTDHVQVKRGQIREHVEAVLGAGGDYTEPELRRHMMERFNAEYGRPSVYTVLRRGLRDGRYEQKEGKRWRMKIA